ncbi:MAG: CoA-binding protein [Chloroflexi bacterium]|nr:CoA-binding protein [Chloroflexota bacterium]
MTLPQSSHPLEYLFHPRSVAIAGASTDPTHWFINEFYIEPLLKMGYQGKIYPINPEGGEIQGLPVYRSLKDIPPPVDHVVSCIPARDTLQLMEECGQVGVRVMQLFTAGFAETGEPDLIELQRRLVETARRYNVRILGPNCMGIYHPGSGLSFCHTYPHDSGPIGLISQSGSNIAFLIRSAVVRGLRFSKAVSYGNACDINECDLLDYLVDDPETKVIAAYFEGTSDGPRLRRVLARAAALKPVVIYKGGYTTAGTRAASSHTGAMAGADNVWEGFLKQIGAIRVRTVGEMVDTLVALVRMKPPRGRTTCIVGAGGGASVLATDEFEQAGFQLPAVPPEIRARIKEIVSLAGSMLSNPMDMVPLFASDQARLLRAGGFDGWEKCLPEMKFHKEDRGWGQFLGILEDWPALDLVILSYSLDANPLKIHDWVLATAAGPMLTAARTFPLPTAMVLHYIADEGSWLPSAKTRQMIVDGGYALFFSMKGAANAIRRLIEFDRVHPGMLPLRG